MTEADGVFESDAESGGGRVFEETGWGSAKALFGIKTT